MNYGPVSNSSMNISVVLCFATQFQTPCIHKMAIIDTYGSESDAEPPDFQDDFQGDISEDDNDSESATDTNVDEAPLGPVTTPVRATHPCMTVFERTRLIGLRALQISMGAPPLLLTNVYAPPIALAEREMSSGVLPYSIERRLPGRQEPEQWRMGDFVSSRTVVLSQTVPNPFAYLLYA